MGPGLAEMAFRTLFSGTLRMATLFPIVGFVFGKICVQTSIYLFIYVIYILECYATYY